jgi:hypothetical protein
MKNSSIISPLWSLVLAIVLLYGCDAKGGFGTSSNKPKSRGAIGEIVVAVDSIKWQGPVGQALRDVFEGSIPGLIRDENFYDLRKVDPRAMNKVLKMSTNIIYVTTFDDKKGGSQVINAMFTKESKEKAAADPSLFMLRNSDEFALDQEVIYLFGNNEAELIQNLKENKRHLQNLFQVRERNRMQKVILARKSSEANMAGQQIGLQLNVPASYQIAKSADNFLWLRQPTISTARPDISLFFYSTDYTSELQTFPDSIIALRERITRQHIYGNPDNRNSFLITERLDPSPVFTNFRINDNFAVEIRGGWKTNNLSMGGSFLAYIMVDAEKGKLYYMEGFVYYPNEAHRESIREIETILLATQLVAPVTKAQ